MKTIVKLGIAFMIAIVLAAAMSGCSTTSKVLTDIEAFNQKAATVLTSPQLVKLENSLVPLVDFGLIVSGNAELVPVNNAGETALASLQTAYATKTAITTDQAKQITSAATLGLVASGNSTWLPYTPEAVQALTSVASVINTSGAIAKAP